MNNQAQRGPLSNAEERNPAVHARDGPEQVVELSLTELYPFKDHPFHVVDDAHMESTAQSIKNNGVLVSSSSSSDTRMLVATLCASILT